jgi:hypothetical protein
MARRWVFKRQQDQSMPWTWRLLGADDCIEHQGGDFEQYGMALQDAIQNGFRPTEDHWIVDTAHEVTHHEHGQKPLVILKQDPTTIPPGTVFATNPGRRDSEQHSSPSIGQTPPERQ